MFTVTVMSDCNILRYDVKYTFPYVSHDVITV